MLPDGISPNADGSWNVEVTLTELLQVCIVGGAAYYESQINHRSDRFGLNLRERVGEGLGIQIDGMLGELVVAKLRNRFWMGKVNAFKAPDIGARAQVRHLQGPDLIVRHNDPTEHVYVLVIGKVPKLTVVGWIEGKDAKRDDWLDDFGNGREQVFRVPNGELHRIPARQIEIAA